MRSISAWSTTSASRLRWNGFWRPSSAAWPARGPLSKRRRRNPPPGRNPPTTKSDRCSGVWRGRATLRGERGSPLPPQQPTEAASVLLARTTAGSFPSSISNIDHWRRELLEDHISFAELLVRLGLTLHAADFR